MKLSLAAAAATALLLADSEPQSVYRAATDGVSVDVSVFDGDRAVSALRPEDFELFDNGVRQTVTAAEQSRLPIDLRLLFDTSGSITRADLQRYRNAMARVTRALRPEDQCEILTFDGRIGGVGAEQRPPCDIALDRGGIDGTSFFDAVSLALVRPPTPRRRHILIVLSDAIDNSSFFDEATTLDAARRTQSVVYGIVPAAGNSRSTPFEQRLHRIADLTGGRVIRAEYDASVASAMLRALEEFRHGYVLHYVVNGVALAGWHELRVSVRGRRYSVRAREGYFGR